MNAPKDMLETTEAPIPEQGVAGEGEQLPEPQEVSMELEAAVEALVARKGTKSDGPSLRLTDNEETGNVGVGFSYEDDDLATVSLMLEFGTTDHRVYSGLLHQIISIGEFGSRVSERNSNFALGVIAEIKPQDAVEVMLATQMAATHQLVMAMGRRLTYAENFQQQDTAERAFNKLSRTYTAQMEALRKHRNGGKQTVTVQHVNVEDGGQAIVGSVSHGGGVDGEK